MRVFEDKGISKQTANFGWQKDSKTALTGIALGYKDCADELICKALEKADIRTLDTYIFPVLFLYRHSIEISIKRIYLRQFQSLPTGGHNLLTLWQTIKSKTIDDLLRSPDAFEECKKINPILSMASIDDRDLSNVELLIKEIQEASQTPKERVINSGNDPDRNAEVWRYLIDHNNELFFSFSHAIDYLSVKEAFNYLFMYLSFIYDMVDLYLSSPEERILQS